MNTAPIMDPLRAARRLVYAAEFRDALHALEEKRNVDLPEWHLLHAMARWRTGDFATSLVSATAALELYREKGDTDGELRAQNVAAAGHFALGRLFEATNGFRRVAFLAREHADTLMAARSTNNIGNIEYFLGHDTAALSSYRKAASLFRQVDLLYGVAEAEHNRSVVHREQGVLADAKQASDLALAAIERLGGGRGLGWVLGGRGETDAMAGDLKLGAAQVRQSITIAEHHEDRLTVIDGHRILVFIERQAGNVKRALEMAREVAAEAAGFGNAWMSAKAETELALCMGAAGRSPEEAAPVWASVADHYGSLGADTRARRIRERARA